MTNEIKFAFVVGCLAVALLSYFRCNGKRDWAWLVAGLAFTVGADYFLALHDRHLPGIAIFCFAHVCYILRARSARCESWATPMIWAKEPGLFAKICDVLFTPVVLFVAVLVAVAIGFWQESVIALAVVYAGLFATSLCVNFYYFARNQKTRIPGLNRGLVLAGLCLFVLCDISVMLYNLPRYNVVAPGNFSEVAASLIWWFYLPSQALLALSALRMSTASPRMNA